MAQIIGSLPAGTVVTQEMLDGMHSAWQASQTYDPLEIVFMKRPRSKLAIWFDRIRLFRWDVPDTILERYQAVRSR